MDQPRKKLLVANRSLAPSVLLSRIHRCRLVDPSVQSSARGSKWATGVVSGSSRRQVPKLPGPRGKTNRGASARRRRPGSRSLTFAPSYPRTRRMMTRPETGMGWALPASLRLHRELRGTRSALLKLSDTPGKFHIQSKGMPLARCASLTGSLARSKSRRMPFAPTTVQFMRHLLLRFSSPFLSFLLLLLSVCCRCFFSFFSFPMFASLSRRAGVATVNVSATAGGGETRFERTEGGSVTEKIATISRIRLDDLLRSFARKSRASRE